MIAWPLFTRELQTEARRSFNYWLRVLGAGTVVLAFAITSLTVQAAPGRHGILLFRSLNSALFLAIWVLVPVLTADCISREKREGTLGLLFLTPLTARDIVVGKALIHSLRAMTLVLAALPLVSLPIILGGIGWRWALDALGSHLAALSLALAAGLIASTRNTEWVRTLVMAEGLSGLFCLGYWAMGYAASSWLAFSYLCVTAATLALGRQASLPPSEPYGPTVISHTAMRTLTLPEKVRASPDRISAVWILACIAVGLGALTWNWLGFGKLVTAVTVLLIAIYTSARRLKEHWQHDLAAPPQPVWIDLFASSDFWQSFFRWNKDRTLDRNPIAWLQEYSWTARLTKWGWCLVIMTGELIAALGARGFPFYQRRLSALLFLGLAFTASGSFRRERQSGALELLLVTPLQARHLLGGRIWGVWCHFVPALSILYVCWTMVPYGRAWDHPLWVVGCLSTFFFVPVIGLYFSLLNLNFLVAWLSTCALGLLLPGASMVSIGRIFLDGELRPSIFCVGQAVVAGYAGFKVFRSLSQRRFLLHDSGT